MQAARFHEVWVLTRPHARPLIEEALARDAVAGLHVVSATEKAQPSKDGVATARA